MLAVEGVTADYGDATLLSVIAGLVREQSGQVAFRGVDITCRTAHHLPGDSLALVPSVGRPFPFISVEENLQLGAFTRAKLAARLDEVMAIFPILTERQGQMAGKLSGGERQMRAIARTLMSHPALLMLDEPSVGLSPLMIKRVFRSSSNWRGGKG